MLINVFIYHISMRERMRKKKQSLREQVEKGSIVDLALNAYDLYKRHKANPKATELQKLEQENATLKQQIDVKKRLAKLKEENERLKQDLQ